MALFDFITDIFFDDPTSGVDAAGAFIDEQRAGEDVAAGFQQPFFQEGVNAIGRGREGTTIGGLDARFNRLRDTDLFGSLLGERTKAVQSGLSAGGLTRSGTAVEELAGVPTELLLELENMLTQRATRRREGDLNRGFAAGSNLTNLRARGGVLRGEAQSSGIITDAQAKAAQTQGLIDFASAFAPIPGGN